MTAAAQTGGKTAYRVKATSVEACNCHHGCNCQFGGFPNEGICEFIIGFDVREGRYGDVDLAGQRAVITAKYPGAIHEGSGRVVLFVDETASDEQASAFAAIFSGREGGMPWEALAATIARFEGPIRKPIEITVDAQRSRIDVPDAIALQLAPLRNPVTGKVNEVHIVYPNGGFFWNDGSIATTEVMRADHGDLHLEWPGRYASVAEVNWSNQQ